MEDAGLGYFLLEVCVCVWTVPLIFGCFEYVCNQSCGFFCIYMAFVRESEQKTHVNTKNTCKYKLHLCLWACQKYQYHQQVDTRKIPLFSGSLDNNKETNTAPG
jgi:hypothetical protein